MVIDTGCHQPIAVRKPHYGLHEGPVMQKTIDTILQLGHSTTDTKVEISNLNSSKLEVTSGDRHTATVGYIRLTMDGWMEREQSRRGVSLSVSPSPPGS
jgi:hypothetical protein